MNNAAVDAVIDGLKKAGVDFVSLMPDSDFSVLQKRVVDDPDFTYVPVSNEAIGVGVCVGAWLSGKRPALLVPTSGLLVAAWPLTSLCMAWSLPLFLLIPYRGDIGDAFCRQRFAVVAMLANFATGASLSRFSPIGCAWIKKLPSIPTMYSVKVCRRMGP